MVCMAGVEYMNDDPAEVDVLYGKVHVKDGSCMLQEVADGVVDHFCSKGLCSCFITLSTFTYATLGTSQPCRVRIEISLSISLSVCMEQLKSYYMDFCDI